MNSETVRLRPAELDDLEQIQVLHQAAYLHNADDSLDLTPDILYRHVFGGGSVQILL